ncbi:MAG: LemA family protein [Candidatus Paceibacterota bacterium]|jgi:hypothetical protein
MVDAKTIGIGAVIVLVILAFSGWSMYIGLNNARLDADKARSDVAVKMKDRHDVIPAFINAAEASFKAQDKILTNYAKNREGLDRAEKLYNEARNNSDDPDAPVKMAEAIREAQNSFEGIIINARQESVPDVDIEALIRLQNEISVRQNVISGFWLDYNAVVNEYNKKVTNPPSSIVASFFGFKTRKTFEATAEEEAMPDTKINV